MKKSLIALAVLGSMAAAQAEVTVYGVADIWVGRTSVTGTDDVKTNTNVMESGGLTSSRIGFKGSKDLGKGLTGVFKLEQAFNLDTGTTDNDETDTDDTFGRLAYVGLAGSFGEVTLGNLWTAMDDVLGASNSGFDSALSASAKVLAVQYNYVGAPQNAVKYVSPSLGGFTLAASRSMKEDTEVKVTDMSLAYAAGNLAANAAYQQQKDGADKVKLTALNASYNLGVVKLLASYGLAKVDGVKTTDIQVGFDLPVTADLTLSAGYAQSKDKDGDKRTGFGLAAGYSLGDSTTVYGGYRQAKAKDEALLTADSDQAKDNVFAIGIKHAF
jgi:predicted porin